MKKFTTAAILTTMGMALLGISMRKSLLAQATGTATTLPARDLPAPVTLTAMEDHRRMMELLGITQLRRGGSMSSVPDESQANPFGGIESLPDPLKMRDGTKVTRADQWRKRRAEIVEMFDREIYGRVPRNLPKVTWEVTGTTTGTTGNIPTVTKNIVGRVDNSAYPQISVNIGLTLTLPANASGPVPVMLIFGGAGRNRGAGTAPATTSPAGAGASGPATDRAGMHFIGAQANSGAPGQGNRAAAGARGPTAQQQVLEKGWGWAWLNTSTIQADNGGGLTSGIIGLMNKGQPRKLDDWGALRAWAWGASRVLDYFEQPGSGVDARQVGLEGHSRWGKATIVTMAYDERFAIAYVSSSGAGGVKLNRRNFGELVENVAGSSEYHWMAGNFIKYGADPLKWSDMPVDQHELVAMCAPRPVFISAGSTHSDFWVDAKGMFMAAAAAQPVYALLGKKTMGTNDFPPVETGLMDGDIAFRQHNGGHADGPNWPTFITFASRYLKTPPSPKSHK